MIYRKSKLRNIFNSGKPDLNKLISENSNLTLLEEKNYYSKISEIFKSIYEDFFPKIISNKPIYSFIKEINEKSMNILYNNFSDNELQTPLMIDNIEKVKGEFKNKINKVHSFLEKSINDKKENI